MKTHKTENDIPDILNSISWQLKCMVEEMSELNNNLRDLKNSRVLTEQPAQKPIDYNRQTFEKMLQGLKAGQ